MKNIKLISIIIPAYKQEKNIISDISRIKAVAEKLRFDWEMICVVDGIKADNTYKYLKKIADKKIRVFGYEKNRGKGYAVRYGLCRAKGEVIAFIDSGMDINPEGILMLIEHMIWYNSDVIVGSVRHSASKVNGYPFFRKLLSWGYHKMTRLLFGLKITDSQRGLKIFKREVLEKVLPRLLVKKYAFDIEMLAVARALGYKKIHDGPVDMDATKLRYSSVTGFTVWSMLWDTLAVFYRLYLLRYYEDKRKQKWKYDPELDMRVNVG